MDSKSIIDQSAGNDVNALCRQIEADSAAECKALLENAFKQEAIVLQNTQEKTVALRNEILQRGQAEIAAFEETNLSEIKLTSQHLWLEAREKLLSETVSTLFSRFESIQQTEAYDQALAAWIEEAAKALETDTLTIKADPVTLTKLSPAKVESLSNGLHLNLTLSSEPIAGHGLLLLSSDGKREYEATLEARFEKNKAKLRNLAAQLLLEGLA